MRSWGAVRTAGWGTQVDPTNFKGPTLHTPLSPKLPLPAFAILVTGFAGTRTAPD